MRHLHTTLGTAGLGKAGVAHQRPISPQPLGSAETTPPPVPFGSFSRPSRARSLLVVGAAVAATWMVGCAPRSGSAAHAGRPYPAQLARSVRTLDIQVFREVASVTLTNTTSRTFGPSVLWLNGRFSHKLDKGLPVGATLDVPLTAFRDEFGDGFRGGGFFAAEPPQPLVLAELESSDGSGRPELLRLVVVADDQG